MLHKPLTESERKEKKEIQSRSKNGGRMRVCEGAGLTLRLWGEAWVVLPGSALEKEWDLGLELGQGPGQGQGRGQGQGPGLGRHTLVPPTPAAPHHTPATKQHMIMLSTQHYTALYTCNSTTLFRINTPARPYHTPFTTCNTTHQQHSHLCLTRIYPIKTIHKNKSRQ